VDAEKVTEGLQISSGGLEVVRLHRSDFIDQEGEQGSQISIREEEAVEELFHGAGAFAKRERAGMAEVVQEAAPFDRRRLQLLRLQLLNLSMCRESSLTGTSR